eukprot:2200213-Rhodomonas_salina.1
MGVWAGEEDEIWRWGRGRAVNAEGQILRMCSGRRVDLLVMMDDLGSRCVSLSNSYALRASSPSPAAVHVRMVPVAQGCRRAWSATSNTWSAKGTLNSDTAPQLSAVPESGTDVEYARVPQASSLRVLSSSALDH